MCGRTTGLTYSRLASEDDTTQVLGATVDEPGVHGLVFLAHEQQTFGGSQKAEPAPDERGGPLERCCSHRDDSCSFDTTIRSGMLAIRGRHMGPRPGSSVNDTVESREVRDSEGITCSIRTRLAGGASVDEEWGRVGKRSYVLRHGSRQ